MRLTGRVRTLERRGGVGGVCPACGGRGRPALVVRFTGGCGAPERTVNPGCGPCGRACSVKVLILEEPGAAESWPPARTAAGRTHR